MICDRRKFIINWNGNENISDDFLERHHSCEKIDVENQFFLNDQNIQHQKISSFLPSAFIASSTAIFYQGIKKKPAKQTKINKISFFIIKNLIF